MTETKPNRPGPKPTGQTPIRSIRVSDEDWELWQAAAERAGAESVSAWLRQLAAKYLKSK